MAETAHTTTEVQHEGGHSGVFPPFDTTTYPSQLLWLALTFGLFYVLMARVVLPRIGGILELRNDKIGRDLDEANRLKAEAEAAGVAYDEALSRARVKAQAIAAETRSALDASVDAKRRAADASLATRIGEAEVRIGEIKTRALAEVDGIAVDTAEELVVSLTGRAVGRDEAVAAVAAVKA